jgi:hypothetical protein
MTLYLALAKNFCNISMYVPCVMHLPDDGHMSDWNMPEVNGVYNIFLYIYGHLLVLISHLNAFSIFTQL